MSHASCVRLGRTVFKQCLGVSYSNMQMHAGILVLFPVLITSVKKHCGNYAGLYMWLSQLMHCFE